MTLLPYLDQLNREQLSVLAAQLMLRVENHDDNVETTGKKVHNTIRAGIRAQLPARLEGKLVCDGSGGHCRMHTGCT
jgi:hypothetical protein